MPSAVDLLPFRPEVERLFTAGYTQRQLLQWLADEHNVVMTERTIRRRLKEWGHVRHNVAHTPTALDSIKNLFYTPTDNAATIAYTLTDQGNTSFRRTSESGPPVTGLAQEK